MTNERTPTGGEGVATDGGTSASEASALTDDELDDLFELLADDQRRRVLAFLAETDDGVATLSELAECVAADPSADSSGDFDRIEAKLHHSHLPKLADAGVVEYDRRSGTVRYRGGQAVADWVALARSHESDASGP